MTGTVERLLTEHLDTWTAAVETKSAAGRGSSKKLKLVGIAKLRELILELAVRGQLVPQDESDEPASVLLERISAESERLVKEKKIKKPKKLPEISEDEKPFDLPGSWEWLRLPDTYYTISPSGKKLKSSDVIDEGRYPVVDQGLSYVSGYTNFEELVIKIPNPVIIFGDHTTNRKYIDFDFVAGADGTKILSPICLNEQYFYKALLSLKLEGRGYARHFKVLNTHLISIPPLAEQYRIVAKVDELMSLCDALEQEQESSIAAHSLLVENLLAALTNAAGQGEFKQAWARVAEHFDTLFTTEQSVEQLKQTILQLAVMGMLVEQDPADKPAGVLLERITAEKVRLVKEKVIKKQKALPEISEEEKAFELPEGWAWCRLGDLSISTEYGLSEKTSQGVAGIPVLAMGNIQNGSIYTTDNKVVPESTKGLPELYLKNRDVLYNRTNSPELVGKTGLFLGEDDVYTFASYLIRINLDKSTPLPEFVNINMMTPFFRQTQIVPHLKQQCGQANVNGTIMKSMIVPVAPEKEQQRIVDQVEKLSSICKLLTLKIAACKKIQTGLAGTLISEAMS